MAVAACIVGAFASSIWPVRIYSLQPLLLPLLLLLGCCAPQCSCAASCDELIVVEGAGLDVVNGWYKRINNLAANEARYAKVDKFGNIYLHRFEGGMRGFSKGYVVVEISRWAYLGDWRIAFAKVPGSLAGAWADNDAYSRHWLYQLVPTSNILPAGKFSSLPDPAYPSQMPPPNIYKAPMDALACTKPDDCNLLELTKSPSTSLRGQYKFTGVVYNGRRVYRHASTPYFMKWSQIRQSWVIGDSLTTESVFAALQEDVAFPNLAFELWGMWKSAAFNFESLPVESRVICAAQSCPVGKTLAGGQCYSSVVAAAVNTLLCPACSHTP